MSIFNKTTNIIGTKLPQWVINQLTTRSMKGALESRNNQNLQYLTNKTAWVRLVSSININGDDMLYFNTKVPGGVNDPSDLAKKFVLFGGTSKYQNINGKPSYELRSGINEGSYGMLGKDEIQKYGYRPMPGITRVNVETQGRLGSVRQATIEFKCWDKMQLDIVDALYFKLGYTMFLEWGHTFYYPSSTDLIDNMDQKKLVSTELYSIDPFQKDLTKEKVFRMISKTSRETDGNYDAMLGVVTNFNFSYNQEGGYDCTISVMSLGFLADSIKINNPTTLPNILKDEILLLKKTLEKINDTNTLENTPIDPNDPNSEIYSIYAYINKIETKNAPAGSQRQVLNFRGLFEPKDDVEYINIITKYGIPNSLLVEPKEKVSETTTFQLDNKFKYDFFFDDINYTGKTLYLQKFGLRIPVNNPDAWIKSITLNKDRFGNIIRKDWINYLNTPVQTYQSYNLDTNPEIIRKKYLMSQPISEYLLSLNKSKNPDIYNSDYIVNSVGSDKNSRKEFNSVTQKTQTVYPYKKNYYYRIKITIPEGLYTVDSENSSIEIYGITLPFSSLPTMSPGQIPTQEATNKLADRANKINLIRKEIFLNILHKITTVGSDLIPEGKVKIDPKSESKDKFNFSIYGTYNVVVNKNTIQTSLGANQVNKNTKSETKAYPIYWEISTEDTSIIENVIPTDNLEKSALFAEYYKLKSDENTQKQNQEEQAKAEQQKLDQEVLSSQILDALSIQSALEIILRTIQVKSLNRSLNQTGKLDLEIGRKVYKYEMYNDRDFLNSIFSNGVYSGIWSQLLNPENINNSEYANASDEKQFLINAKYGFATTLLGSNSLKDEDIFKEIEDKYVDHKQLLTSYVVPYQIDQDLIVGVKTNHPVYIPLGTLLMLLNHCCNLYDTKLDTISSGGVAEGLGNAAAQAGKIVSTLSKGFQKPLIYIDYNPKLNFFLTNAKQLSTNPWVTLIPFEGTTSDYRQLFDENIIKGNSIDAIKELNGEQGQDNKQTPLFDIGSEDRLSYWLPKIKDGESAYRGKIMNVLINIDYLTGLIKNYSFQDSSNNIYLKPFLEQILSDVNKYLGNFNAFRVSYNDTANTLQIVDDQIIPPIGNDKLIPYNIDPEIPENRTELPVVGLNSIAKSLDIKTEIPSRLGNLIAISANSDIKQQSQRSINADSIGFINVNYTDRYIPRRFSNSDLATSTKNGEIISSIQFNKSVEDFYSSINIAYQDVSQMTSYYIEKMSKVKANESGSRASMMIPVSVNLSTDGIGGLSMGHSFTIPEQMLPYNYYSKKANTGIDGTVNQVGFAIVGLSHTIEGNTWNTSLKANMVAVKDMSSYKWTIAQLRENKKDFAVSSNYGLPYSGATPNANLLRDSLKNLGYQEKGREISNAGDISATMAQKASLLFAFIRDRVPGVTITVTGGHDQYHVPNNPGSLHNTGNAVDFIVYPNQQKDINAVANIINEKARALGIGFLNEYDKQSEYATARHFHIYVI